MEAATNEALIEEYQAAGPDQKPGILFQIYEKNIGLIIRFIAGYRGRAEREDLLQDAFIAVIYAADSYNPEEGKFSTWLVYWLKSVINRSIENTSYMIRIPASGVRAVLKYRKACREYETMTGAAPSDRDIMRLLEISAEALQAVRQAEKALQIASIDAPAVMDDGDDMSLYDILPDGDPCADRLEELQHEEMREAVRRSVAQLPADQAEIIRAVYRDDMTIKEAAARAGLEYNRAKEARNKALKTLCRDKDLRKYF